MKIKLFLISILTAGISASPLIGSEYNFYFYGDDDEKPKVKKEKEEEVSSVQESKGVTQEEISQLANEMAEKLAAKLKPEEPKAAAAAPVTTPAVVAVPSPVIPVTQSADKGHSLIPEKYLSVGVNYDHIDYKFSRDAYSVGILTRAKFLPLITLEGSFPLEERLKRNHSFRAGALLELNLTRTFGINLGGGTIVGRKVFQPPLVIRKAFTPYVGAGARIRIADHLDLMASYNMMYESFKNQIKYGTEGSKMVEGSGRRYFEQILTAGVSYVF